MAYPTTLDSFINPLSTDPLSNPSHSGQHTNQNIAVTALEAKVGANSSAVTTTHDYKLSGVAGSDKAASLTGTEIFTGKTYDTAGSGNTLKINGTQVSDKTGTGKIVLDNAATITTPVISAPTLTLANTSPTVIGGIGYDQTNQHLQIGSGSAAQTLHVGAGTAWTPAWGGLTLGNGTSTGGYSIFGKWVAFWARLTWGSTTSAAGSWTLTMVTTARSASGQYIGQVYLQDTGNANYYGIADAGGGLFAISTGSTYATQAGVSNTVPFTWNNTDLIIVSGLFEAA